jgi:hypothetical protein
MSVKLNDTQLVLPSAASHREDHYLTLPSGARLALARKTARNLLAGGLVREVRSRGEAPVWRGDEETERAFALKWTAARLKAIAAGADDGVDEEPYSNEVGTAATTSSPEPVNSCQAAGQLKSSASPVAPRSGTKIDDVVKMLCRPEGATIDALVKATGWLPRTTRAALTGLRKRGYAIGRSRTKEGGSSVYRLTAPSQMGV